MSALAMAVSILVPESTPRKIPEASNIEAMPKAFAE